MPLKVFGALLLVLTGCGGGWLFARKLRVRRSFLTAFLTFLSNLATNVRYRSDPINTLVNSSGELFDLPEGISPQPFQTLWLEQISIFPKKWQLKPRDMELLEEFGARLGATDTEGQLAHIALYRSLFQKQLDEAAGELSQKARLYHALGLFSGVSAALLIW